MLQRSLTMNILYYIVPKERRYWRKRSEAVDCARTKTAETTQRHRIVYVFQKGWAVQNTITNKYVTID